MRRQELLKTKSGEFEMVLSLKVSVLVALVESPSNIARIFQAQQLSCCGFMHEKYPMSSRVCRECVRNLDLRVQVHPGELWVSKQRVHIVLEASKSAGAKGDVAKICGFVHPLHPL